MSKQWRVKNPNPQLQAKFSNALRIHPIVAQLLINRKFTDIKRARDFLEADLSGLHDPFLFKDMDKAVARIREAAKNKERVLVFGDYDVDGVTSSVIATQALDRMGIDVINHIPHRMEDGYGLNHEIAEFAKRQGATLLLAVDCGTTAWKEVDTINAAGVDVIIVDHHRPEETLPNAYALINPRQEDCAYPFKDLASVGLVAKLIHALEGKVNTDILDLVALGTIADIVPLHGENRIFVKAGLPRVNITKNAGLRALLDLTKIGAKKLTPFHVGFVLGPRINAAGRMDSAHKSLDLFLCKDLSEAQEIAKDLDKQNTARQKLQREVADQAMDIVEQEINFKDDKVIVLSKEGWHKGVLGIVASKITDKYYRPSIVISIKDGVGTASARSIDGFHLHEALTSCAEHLENYGGHEGAAGLTIKEENIDPFRALINSVARDILKPQKLEPGLDIDCQIPITSVTMELADIIDSMEPFGEGNPSPVFCSQRVVCKSYPKIMGKDTIKFWIEDEDFTISAVGFGMAKYAALIRPGAVVDLAYEVSIDDWNKAPIAQLKLKDIRTNE